MLLDAYARRHEAQKIYLRQMAAQRCISARKQILDSTGGPNPSNEFQLYALDAQLQQVCELLLLSDSGDAELRNEVCRKPQIADHLQEVQQITDEFVYLDLLGGDQSLGRWTVEDPGLFDILNWLSTRS